MCIEEGTKKTIVPVEQQAQNKGVQAPNSSRYLSVVWQASSQFFKLLPFPVKTLGLVRFVIRRNSMRTSVLELRSIRIEVVSPFLCCCQSLRLTGRMQGKGETEDSGLRKAEHSNKKRERIENQNGTNVSVFCAVVSLWHAGFQAKE